MDSFPVFYRTKTMRILLLIIWFTLKVHYVQGEPGILKTKYFDTNIKDFATKEYCIGYSSFETPLPKLAKEPEFRPLLDRTDTDLCKTPSNAAQLKGTLVAVLRGNCTFVNKGLVAQKAGANGTIVVTDSAVIAPSMNESVKIPVVLLTAEDHRDIIRKAGDNKLVQGVLYNPEVPEIDWNLLVIWLMAVGTIAIGGYWCGVTAYRQAKLQRKRERATAVQASGIQQSTCNSDSSEEEDVTEEEEESVTITPVIVLIWVCMIFAVLLLLFFFYDYVVYVVITLYCIGACNGMHQCLAPIGRKIIPWKQRLPPNKVPFLSTRPTIVSVILALGSIAFVACWFVYRHEDFAWILLDTLGICFCISILRLIRLKNFKTCFLLLGLLFIYDIFFVFITPLFTKDGKSVMVEVATGGDGAKEQIPVLLVVPRLSHSAFSVCNMYSMLGFGDILVPGLLVGYCHTFDFKVQSRKIYFISSCIAYGVGLVITFVALALMQTGQPALLYLVPCTVLTVLMIAAIRGEVAHLWHGQVKSDHHVL
ncbi:signal peptide peptidase-like 2B [Amphiura filiformis]|uniref:signal peptide peptidase-like 2B n=1 Tax=Amphiura filiformis TaxID=82378 RepID=UPI003B222264